MDWNLKKLVAHSIKGLPYHEKAVLSLYYNEQLNFMDIARVMDMKRPDGRPDAPRVRRLYIKGINKVFGFTNGFNKDYLDN